MTNAHFSLNAKLTQTKIARKQEIQSRLGLNIDFYQSRLILTALFEHDLINVSYLTACYLYQVMMTLHFLNDVANDAESTQALKIRHDS